MRTYLFTQFMSDLSENARSHCCTLRTMIWNALKHCRNVNRQMLTVFILKREIARSKFVEHAISRTFD